MVWRSGALDGHTERRQRLRHRAGVGEHLVGDRQAMSARQSEDFRFNQDVTAFRVTERVDGRPWLASSITPYNGSSNKLSPFVKLA